MAKALGLRPQRVTTGGVGALLVLGGWISVHDAGLAVDLLKVDRGSAGETPSASATPVSPSTLFIRRLA